MCRYIYHNCVLIFCFAVFISPALTNSTQLAAKHRIKRNVVFTKSSKYFFRFNGKLNTFNWTQIFAYGYTVRVNYDLPHDIPKRYQLFKRDIHEDIQNIPDELASQGFSCMLKHICDAYSTLSNATYCGFFCEIGKIVVSEEGMENRFFKRILDKCDHYRQRCPHHLPLSAEIDYG
nr:unnamed protein product [Callosobruchus analis]